MVKPLSEEEGPKTSYLVGVGVIALALAPLLLQTLDLSLSELGNQSGKAPGVEIMICSSFGTDTPHLLSRNIQYIYIYLAFYAPADAVPQPLS